MRFHYALPSVLVALLLCVGLCSRLSAQSSGPEPGFAVDNGDVNGDFVRDLTDGIYFLRFLVLGGEEPVPLASCAGRAPNVQNGDANGDSSRDLTDAIGYLGWLFLGGEEPVQACGHGLAALIAFPLAQVGGDDGDDDDGANNPNLYSGLGSDGGLDGSRRSKDNDELRAKRIENGGLRQIWKFDVAEAFDEVPPEETIFSRMVGPLSTPQVDEDVVYFNVGTNWTASGGGLPPETLRGSKIVALHRDSGDIKRR
jgi:hypothetical protein